MSLWSLMGGGGLSATTGASGYASNWSGWLNTAVGAYSAYQGSRNSGSSSGGTGGVNWSQALLSGLGSAADSYMGAKMDEKTAARMGLEQRKTAAFAGELEDYYKQKGKQRKRVALDTYGQFSTTNRWAPNMTAAPAVEVPVKPNPGA